MSIESPRGRSRSPAALRAGPTLFFYRASVGPNYGVGPIDYHPAIAPSGLESGRVVIIPANYGLDGGADVDPYHRMEPWAERVILSKREYPVPTNPYGPESAPMWNLLNPPTTFGLRVITPAETAAMGQAQVRNVQAPATPASLSSATLAAAGGGGGGGVGK